MALTDGSGSPFRSVTEENRQARIDAIMPVFIETVRYWQQQGRWCRRDRADSAFHRGNYALESVRKQSRVWLRA